VIAERGIVPIEQVATILRAISDLERQQFAPLVNIQGKRGLFLLYEDFLIERLGAAGGILQTCRSRNDLNATVFRLRLRAPLSSLIRCCLAVEAVLTRLAFRWNAMSMPIYTHRQPGVPGTLGHYLGAVAQSLIRDLQFLAFVIPEMQRCPLGAGAGGGTNMAIDPTRTAALLGFDHAVVNSLDAVAARDVVLRILAALSILNVTLSRLASDWILWTTEEFGFIALPDELVGSSSSMPQKRNPFLLEHVEGRSAHSLGAFVSAATSMHSAAFSNSIAVGTEGVKPLWDSMHATEDVLELMRLILLGSRPNASRMHRRAVESYTVAMPLAHRLMQSESIDYRKAHRQIGAIIREEIETGVGTDSGLRAMYDPLQAALDAEFGGGPGPLSQRRSLSYVKQEQLSLYRTNTTLWKKWRFAQQTLDKAAAQLSQH
jgi:argininosuccinate lyase